MVGRNGEMRPSSLGPGPLQVNRSVDVETDMEHVRLAEQRATVRWALRILVSVLIVGIVAHGICRLI